MLGKKNVTVGRHIVPGPAQQLLQEPLNILTRKVLVTTVEALGHF